MNRENKIREIIEKINRLENPIDENEIIEFAMLSADIVCKDEKKMLIG